MNRIKAGILAAALFAVPLTMNHFNEYSTYKNYDVKVVDVISGMSSGKHSSLQFIAVYEMPDGYRFDRYISASTYTWMKPGQNVTLELRPFDVKQNWPDTVIWVLGAIFANFVGFVTGSWFALRAASRRFNNWIDS